MVDSGWRNSGDAWRDVSASDVKSEVELQVTDYLLREYECERKKVKLIRREGPVGCSISCGYVVCKFPDPWRRLVD